MPPKAPASKSDFPPPRERERERESVRARCAHVGKRIDACDLASCNRVRSSLRTFKTRSVLLLFLSLLFVAACSSRGCATCVGYTPTKSIAELPKIAVSIEHVTGGDIDGPYAAMHAGFSIEGADKSDMCGALPEATTLAWNGATQKPTRNGGGQNMWCGRGDAYTLCGQVEATFPSTNNLLLNGPGPSDHLIINDGASSLDVTIASGRPKIDKAIAKDLTVVFDGLDGSIQDASPCAFRVGSKTGCMPLEVTSKSGNQLTAKLDPKPRVAGDWLLVGRVVLRPKATCASKTCTATLSYAMRVPFTLLP
jgi:hypothetical protein